jgi:hypothetical protein
MSDYAWLTEETLKTVGGSCLAVWIVCSALQHAFKFNPRWLALVVAEVISVFVAHSDRALGAPLAWLLAVLNGFVIYLTSVGVNAVHHRLDQDRLRTRSETHAEPSGRRFSSPWW